MGPSARTFWICCGCVLLLGACKGQPAAFEQQLEARRLAAQLFVSVTSAADAGNRAVMADTDAASLQFADEARSHAAKAEQARARLERVLRSLNYEHDLEQLAAFGQAFERFRALDGEILGLAVENTNLKAQRLSFGPAREAAEAFEAALDRVESAAPEPRREHVRVLSLRAQLGLREIQVLEAPHIAAAEEAAMTALEAQMNAALARVRAALSELGDEPGMADVNAALNRFTTVHAELLTLSRRNSNVRSLALALGQKHALTAACEAALRALSAGLDKHTFTATR